MVAHALGRSRQPTLSAIAHRNAFFCTVGTRLGAQGMGKSATIGPATAVRNYGGGKSASIFRRLVAQTALITLPTTGDSATVAIGQALDHHHANGSIDRAVTTGRILTPTFIKPDAAAAELLVNTIDWPQEAWQAVLEGMRACVEAPLGTGRSMRMEGVSVLAKTGTAENVPGKAPHAWTIAALPAEQPTLVGVCVVEHGGSGGRVAAPILKKILAAAWNAKQGE